MTTTKQDLLFIHELGELYFPDIARVLRVDIHRLRKWALKDGTPLPREQKRLAELHFVVSRLSEFYDASDVRKWLYARHPLVGAKPAIEAIRDGQVEAVLCAIDQMDDSVYI